MDACALHHLCAWYPWISPGTGIRDDLEPSCGCWKLSSGLLQEQALSCCAISPGPSHYFLLGNSYQSFLPSQTQSSSFYTISFAAAAVIQDSILEKYFSFTSHFKLEIFVWISLNFLLFHPSSMHMHLSTCMYIFVCVCVCVGLCTSQPTLHCLQAPSQADTHFFPS